MSSPVVVISQACQLAGAAIANLKETVLSGGAKRGVLDGAFKRLDTTRSEIDQVAKALESLDLSEQEAINARMSVAAGLHEDAGARLALVDPNARPITELIALVKDTRRVEFDGQTNLMQVLGVELDSENLSDDGGNLLYNTADLIVEVLGKLDYAPDDASIDTLAGDTDAWQIRPEGNFVDERLAGMSISSDSVHLINAIFNKAGYDDLISFVETA